MAQIIKTYKQSVPALRFIGKKYTEADRENGTFGAKWGEWHQNGWFDVIEKQMNQPIAEIYEDGDAYIGLIKGGHTEPFEYWIGILMPEDTAVPAGFEHIDFAKSNLGICWIYGSESEIYLLEGQCGEQLQAEGFEVMPGWCFERYACPRFTTPDEHGNVILDIGFFVK